MPVDPMYNDYKKLASIYLNCIFCLSIDRLIRLFIPMMQLYMLSSCGVGEGE